MSKTAINSSNLYIDLNTQGAGTLTGDNVDQTLVAAKVERVLSYADGFKRLINPASESTLFSAGQIDATPVEVEFLRTQIAMYAQQCFFAATCIPQITIYRADVINGKITVTETIKYTNCYVMSFDTSVQTKEGENLSSIIITFRYDQRDDTVAFFDQDGNAKGNNASTINFPKGTLQTSGGGGGGGGTTPVNPVNPPSGGGGTPSGGGGL